MIAIPSKKKAERAAFTLVELLVVMGVVLILATLAVSIVPRVTEQQKVSQAASTVQGWLSIAKNWALRDQSPRGVRLTYDTSNRVTTLQYVEQPDDYSGPAGSFISYTPGTPTFTVTANNVDFWGGYTSGESAAWPVQLNDLIEIDSGNRANLYRITAIPSATTLTVLANPSTTAAIDANYTTNYRIIRSPRVRTGEAPLNLPEGVAIDMHTNSTYGSTPPVQATSGMQIFDVLFSSTGSVITNGVSGDVRLWLIDTTLNTNTNVNTFDGAQFIVTVAARSGFISIQPVDATLNTQTGTYSSPYSFTQDGRASGF